MNTSGSVDGGIRPARSISGGNDALSAALKLCVAKTRRNIQRLADEPKSAAWALDGNYFDFTEGFFEIGNWTSSFFTGMALLAWKETEDDHFLKQVLRLAPFYRKKVFERHLETHHDLGFLASLYSVALYKLTGDREHREVGIQSAEVLSQRFNEKGNFIRAWGRIDTPEHDNMAIIDCLMNLPLLHWASNETGDKRFGDIAALHANTVLNHFVRSDGSVVHAFRFDLNTGAPLGPDNYCGASTDSYWARGAAWAIYGFALSYAYTGEKKYLRAAERLSDAFIAELDEQVIPVWDFRLPPGKPRVRDASAAAVAVCGFQELAPHCAGNSRIATARERLLQKLCSAECLDPNPECPGVLKSAYGDKPAYSSWGDYFLMEAVVRELRGSGTFW